MGGGEARSDDGGGDAVCAMSFARLRPYANEKSELMPNSSCLGGWLFIHATAIASAVAFFLVLGFFFAASAAARMDACAASRDTGSSLPFELIPGSRPPPPFRSYDIPMPYRLRAPPSSCTQREGATQAQGVSASTAKSKGGQRQQSSHLVVIVIAQVAILKLGLRRLVQAGPFGKVLPRAARVGDGALARVDRAGQVAARAEHRRLGQ